MLRGAAFCHTFRRTLYINAWVGRHTASIRGWSHGFGGLAFVLSCDMGYHKMSYASCMTEQIYKGGVGGCLDLAHCGMEDCQCQPLRMSIPFFLVHIRNAPSIVDAVPVAGRDEFRGLVGAITGSRGTRPDARAQLKHAGWTSLRHAGSRTSVRFRHADAAELHLVGIPSCSPGRISRYTHEWRLNANLDKPQA
jgi:hypothetical protein